MDNLNGEEIKPRKKTHKFLKGLIVIVFALVTYFAYKNIANIFGVGMVKEIITLGLSILAGALTYGICVIVFKVDEVNLIINTLRKKLEKG